MVLKLGNDAALFLIAGKGLLKNLFCILNGIRYRATVHLLALKALLFLDLGVHRENYNVRVGNSLSREAILNSFHALLFNMNLVSKLLSSRFEFLCRHVRVSNAGRTSCNRNDFHGFPFLSLIRSR